MENTEIKNLIAEARESAAFEIDELGPDAYVGVLLNRLADALEAEHQRRVEAEEVLAVFHILSRAIDTKETK